MHYSGLSPPLPLHQSQGNHQPYMEQRLPKKIWQNLRVHRIPATPQEVSRQLVLEKTLTMEKDNVETEQLVLNPLKLNSLTPIWDNPNKWTSQTHEVR